MARAKKKKDDDAVVFETLFSLIEKKGWQDVSLPALARALKMPLGALMEKFPDRNAVLIGFGTYVDSRVIAGVSSSDAPLKEKLFDILMARLDVLQAYRGGLIRLLADMQVRPFTAAFLGLEAGPHLCCSMQKMLECAGIPSGTPQSFVAAMGLKLVYLATLRVWKNDSSKDMSATMAALDRALDRLLKMLRISPTFTTA